jgi:hypothetical protein
MAQDELIFVNPTGTPRDRSDDIRVALTDLAERRVGFLGNTKPNANVLLGRVEEALSERFGIAARHYVKTSPSVPAEAELLDDVARHCEAVVVASLD